MQLPLIVPEWFVARLVVGVGPTYTATKRRGFAALRLRGFLSNNNLLPSSPPRRSASAHPFSHTGEKGNRSRWGKLIDMRREFTVSTPRLNVAASFPTTSPSPLDGEGAGG